MHYAYTHTHTHTLTHTNTCSHTPTIRPMCSFYRVVANYNKNYL